MSEQSNAVMLPKDVRPVLYDLILTPDLDSFTFAGEETVDIEVLESTSSVTLNCAEIEVASCRVTVGDATDLTPSDTSFDEQAETVTFGFDRPLPVGPARLHVEFTGVLNDLLRGFYRSRYVDEDGAERHLATTQFEATDARRAFPCWDEPALKAQFRLTLVVPSDLAAVSNTLPVSESDLPGGLRRVTFGDTPVMSTYLLAFVVGDLRSIEQRAPCGTLVRVWGTPGKERQGQFALDLSVKLLDYFNGYFGVPYPLGETRPHSHPGLRGGRDGELGRDHLPGERAAGRSRAELGGDAPERRGHRGARDGAHVVRRPGYDGVVERPVAERGLRLVDGRQVGRLRVPGVGRVDAVRLVRHERGPRPGRSSELPPHRAAGRQPVGDRPALRRDQLQQGRGRTAHAGAVPGPGRVPAGHRALHLQAPVRQRAHPGPVGRAGRGVGTAGQGDDE